MQSQVVFANTEARKTKFDIFGVIQTQITQKQARSANLDKIRPKLCQIWLSGQDLKILAQLDENLDMNHEIGSGCQPPFADPAFALIDGDCVGYRNSSQQLEIYLPIGIV